MADQESITHLFTVHDLQVDRLWMEEIVSQLKHPVDLRSYFAVDQLVSDLQRIEPSSRDRYLVILDLFLPARKTGDHIRAFREILPDIPLAVFVASNFEVKFYPLENLNILGYLVLPTTAAEVDRLLDKMD